jgi:hypothetical protein
MMDANSRVYRFLSHNVKVSLFFGYESIGLMQDTHPVPKSH